MGDVIDMTTGRKPAAKKTAPKKKTAKKKTVTKKTTPEKPTAEKKSKGRQGQIPGTEREEIEKLTEALITRAAAIIAWKNSKSAVDSAQAVTDFVFQQLIDEGEIEQPTLSKPFIYRYEDNDGKLREFDSGLRTYTTDSFVKEDSE